MFFFQLKKLISRYKGRGSEISAETAPALHWPVGEGHCRPAQTACRRTGWTLIPSAEAARIFVLVVCPTFEICLRWRTVEHDFRGRDCKMNSQRSDLYLYILVSEVIVAFEYYWIPWFAGSEQLPAGSKRSCRARKRGEKRSVCPFFHMFLFPLLLFNHISGPCGSKAKWQLGLGRARGGTAAAGTVEVFSLLKTRLRIQKCFP